MSGAGPDAGRRTALRDVLWVAGAIALYVLLSLVVLPRLGFST